MKLRVDEVFCFVSEDAEGNEGVCAFHHSSGHWMPMVGADRARAESLMPIARQMKASLPQGTKIKLLRFSKRSLLEEI